MVYKEDTHALENQAQCFLLTNFRNEMQTLKGKISIEGTVNIYHTGFISYRIQRVTQVDTPKISE